MDPSEDDYLSLDLPSGPDVIAPEGATNLFPRNIGPRIFYIPNMHCILKAGKSVKMSEAEAMRFVSRRTSIPAPEVYDAYVKDGIGYIFMSKATGDTLGDVWKNLDMEHRASVISQLRQYMEQLERLSGTYYGALWNQASQDIFFHHLPFAHLKPTYGPYHSRQQYNAGLVEALKNSRPRYSLSVPDSALADKLLALNDEAKVFSHGDFHPYNIMVDGAGRVTAIIDWEAAGFSIRGREYFEARKRARDPEWAEALDQIFPEEVRVQYELLKELDQALVQYTCI